MKCQELDSTFRVFNQMKQKTTVSWNTMNNCWIRTSYLAFAWKHFEEMMHRRYEIPWNTMNAELVRKSCFEYVILTFREMLSSGMKPDKVTMAGIASACGHLGAPELTKWAYAYIKKFLLETVSDLAKKTVDSSWLQHLRGNDAYSK